jgi:hypothetical protein
MMLFLVSYQPCPFFQEICNAYYTECFSLAGSSRKLELLSRPILKEHAMYMDSVFVVFFSHLP